MSETKTSAAKLKRGVVTKNKMDKTVVVEVSRRHKHPKYPKILKQRASYKAHDGDNSCNVGDVVILEETRPMSKTKRWRVKEVVKRAAVDL